MHISAIYIHPIKSLLPIPLPSAKTTPLGLPHDRTFVLVRTPENTPLFIGKVSQLCLFSVSFSGHSNDYLTITFLPSPEKKLTIPLVPELAGKEKVEVCMHHSSCAGFVVSEEADAFFSTHLGFSTRLLFLGSEKRKVLGNVAPQEKGLLARLWGERREYGITFADCAPLLIVSAASLREVGERCGGEVDIRKFRPNVVVDGTGLEAWEEDYWGELLLGEGVKVECTANCARCTSVNVEFATGGYVDKDKQPLKKLMKDRRVDPGMKYSPIFGRYGFVLGEGEGEIRVGDEVRVTRRNEERTEFYWPGLSTGTEKA